MLLDHLVLLLNGLEAGLHGGDLETQTSGMYEPPPARGLGRHAAQPLHSKPEVSCESLDAEGVTGRRFESSHSSIWQLDPNSWSLWKERMKAG